MVRLHRPLAVVVAATVVAVVFGSLGTLLASGTIATYAVAALVVVLVVGAVRYGAGRAVRTTGSYW